MRIIKTIIIDTLIGVWFLGALISIVCLLSYNDFATTQLGNYTLLIIDSDDMQEKYGYKEGDLLIVKRTSDKNMKVGESAFYYDSSKKSSVLVYAGEIEKITPVTPTESTFVISGVKVSGEYVIGTMNKVGVYHHAGTILSVMTSKWGFMFFIIFPTLFLIIYEIMMIVESFKEDKDEDE